MAQRVLAIDDDPMILQFVSTVLQSSGFSVETAAGGAEGLKRADAAPPDLVLLDVVMPGLDGYEVCRALRQGPKTAQIPVVMLTASNEPALNKKAFEAGASACIRKPFRTESLVATIHAVLASLPRSEKPRA